MLWGIRYLTDWRDYWDWDDWDNWSDDTPLRFDTQNDADKYIMDMCIDEFVKGFDRFERSLPKRYLRAELRRMRIEALENAGLINHPFSFKDDIHPVVGIGGMYGRPSFTRDKYKSVPDSEMDDPVEDHGGESPFSWKYSKWNTHGR
jgi:hypothetical protein